MRARIRSIRPEQLDDPAFAKMGRDEGHRARCERTWCRLQMLADDGGYVLDDSFMLARALYPAHRTVTDVDVDDELWTLAEHGKVTRYEAATGRLVIHVADWAEIQHPQKPKPSVLPPLDVMSRIRTRTGFLLDESATGTGRIEDESARVRSGLVWSGEDELHRLPTFKNTVNRVEA